jgi:predicted MFS family arabinose efflux permease
VRPTPLTHPAFRRLFAAQSISALGDRLVPVALAFAVLDLTGSVTDLGIVLAAQTIPLVVFVLLGGVWSDRLPRRSVMVGSDCVRTVAQGTSAALLLTGTAHVWELAGLQAVYGVAAAFFAPAAIAVVPQTVGADDLQPANAMMGLSANVAEVLGPAAAGAIVGTIGPGWGLAFDAATFVGSAVCLAGMRINGPGSAAPRQRMIAELRAGWRAFSSRTWLWTTVLVFTLYLAFGLAPLQVLGPQVARLSLGGPGAWAAISVGLGLGALAGGLLAFRLRPRYPLRFAFIALLIATPTLVALLAAHAPLPLLVLAAVIDGSTGTLFNIFWFTAMQSDVPAAELSRVSSWDYLGSLGITPVGQLAAGPIAIAIGISSTLYLAAGLALILFALALAVPAVRNFTAAGAVPRPPRPAPDRVA